MQPPQKKLQQPGTQVHNSLVGPSKEAMTVSKNSTTASTQVTIYACTTSNPQRSNQDGIYIIERE
jgi:hypothetical protein